MMKKDLFRSSPENVLQCHSVELFSPVLIERIEDDIRSLRVMVDGSPIC